ncbi:MAG: amidophosphoribosyltransferase [Myxococcales bacterium]|nr:amidophosphoribosyltransferase [Myxococcales bacterium]
MCGFVGLIGVDSASTALCLGLQAVQHRGQDAAGIATYDGAGRLHLYKDLGRVAEVFSRESLQTLTGRAGVAQVRYPTVGASTRNDAQPFITRRPSIALAHNGNVTNLTELNAYLESRGMRTYSGCDAEPILLILADELLRLKVTGHTADDLAVAVTKTMSRVRGSYSVVAVLEVDDQPTLVAFRDPHGIRPAVYGQRADGAWSAVSESVSLDVNDFRLVGEVPPGSMVLLRAGAEPVVRELLPEPRRACVFEDIYFARPDSVMSGGSVYARRWALGERLADEWKAKGLEADVVVAVPDTSRPAAQAMAERLGLPYREGFIKNRYSARTFIMPDQATREAEMRLKINLIDGIFRDQRVIVVDDSIVRGTTMRRLVSKVREHGPAAVHVTIFSPAVKHPCFYGIDMPSKQELVAHGPATGPELEDRLAEHFGADSVTFLSREGLVEVAGNDICAACFTGAYPVEVDEEERGHIVRDRRPDAPTAAAS